MPKTTQRITTRHSTLKRSDTRKTKPPRANSVPEKRVQPATLNSFDAWRELALACTERSAAGGLDDAAADAFCCAIDIKAREALTAALAKPEYSWRDAALVSEIAGYFARKSGGNEFHSMAFADCEDDTFTQAAISLVYIVKSLGLSEGYLTKPKLD